MWFLEMFRSFDGIWYYIVAFLCIVFIMAIIGFLMEREQKKKEESFVQSSIDNVPPKAEQKPVVVKEPVVKRVAEARPIIDFMEVTEAIADSTVVQETEILEEDNTSSIPNIILDDSPKIDDTEEKQVNRDSPFILEINSSDFEQSNLVVGENRGEK